MKKFVISGLILCSLLTSSVMTFARIDKRIKASSHSTKITSHGGIYALGSTTSKVYHYTSVILLCNTNGQQRTSGREWGTGEVSTSTDSMVYNKNYNYGSQVYYGFGK